ncbi:MAG: hypothetical protein ACXAAI_04795 [Promethearchaeota archaeon]|jgi:hypothetical protein
MELVDVLHGTFSLLFVIISFIIGVTILSKYFKKKNRLLVLVGLTWIGLSFPWLPDSVSFIMNLFTQQTISTEWYFIIGNVLLPVPLITWILAYSDMISRDRKKVYTGLILAVSAVFEIIFFALLFIDVNLLGTMTSAFSTDFGIFLTVSLFLTLIIMLVTGLKFAGNSIRSDEKEIRLKGKLLRAAFISFTIAAILEKSARSIMLGLVFDNPTNPILSTMLAVVRTLLVLSAFEFYGGFLLPRWMENILSKKA